MTMDEEFTQDLQKITKFDVETFKEFLFQEKHLPFTMEKYNHALEQFTEKNPDMKLPVPLQLEMNGQIKFDTQITDKMQYGKFIELVKEKKYTYKGSNTKFSGTVTPAVLLVPSIVKKIGHFPEPKRERQVSSEALKEKMELAKTILGNNNQATKAVPAERATNAVSAEPRKKYVFDPEKEKKQNETDAKNKDKVVKFKALLQSNPEEFGKILSPLYVPVNARCDDYYSCKDILSKNPAFEKVLALLEDPENTSLFPFLSAKKTSNSTSSSDKQSSDSCPRYNMPANTHFVAFGQLEKLEGGGQYTAIVNELMIPKDVQLLNCGVKLLEFDNKNIQFSVSKENLIY
jgi:hypothetical protein